jgi:hypothetical protein
VVASGFRVRGFPYAPTVPVLMPRLQEAVMLPGLGPLRGTIVTKGASMATPEKTKGFAAPGDSGSPVELKARYENFIGGRWVAPDHYSQTKCLLVCYDQQPLGLF